MSKNYLVYSDNVFCNVYNYEQIVFIIKVLQKVIIMQEQSWVL